MCSVKVVVVLCCNYLVNAINLVFIKKKKIVIHRYTNRFTHKIFVIIFHHLKNDKYSILHQIQKFKVFFFIFFSNKMYFLPCAHGCMYACVWVFLCIENHLA